MPIVFARIDDRLIHGQVTVGWTRVVAVDTIIIANDQVVENQVQCSVLKMVAPVGVTVEIVTVEGFCESHAAGNYDRKRVMLILTTPIDALAVMDRGVTLPKLNVGGLRFAPGKVRVSHAVSISPEEEQAFRGIVARGTMVELQMVSTDPRQDFAALLERKSRKS